MELVLKCDITRVINYDFNPDTKIAPYFGGIGHHGISHSSSFDGMKLFGEMHKWHHDFLADFIKTLKDEDPLNPGKSYLENTLIFMSNELGSQSNSNGNGYDNNHLRIDIPTVLIGNVNDYFKTGRYIDYRNSNEPRNGRWWRPVGHPYNQVLQTVMSAYGVTYQDWEQDGIVGYGDYRGMHYGKSFPDIMSLGDKRSPLPGIKA